MERNLESRNRRDLCDGSLAAMNICYYERDAVRLNDAGA
jgi:hypothetical protein